MTARDEGTGAMGRGEEFLEFKEALADALTKAHAAVPRGDLDIILEWYGGLSPGARQNLSLADLHGLSKRLGAPAEVRS